MRNFITLPTFPAFKTHQTAIQYKLAVRSQIKIKMWPTNGPTVKSGWKAKKHKTKKGNSKLKSCSVQPTRQAKPSGALIVLLFSSGELNLILSSPSRKAGPSWVLVSIWCHPSRQAELGWLQTSQDVIWQVVTLPPHQTHSEHSDQHQRAGPEKKLMLASLLRLIKQSYLSTSPAWMMDSSQPRYHHIVIKTVGWRTFEQAFRDN